jgi:hypothetical protein
MKREFLAMASLGLALALGACGASNTTLITSDLSRVNAICLKAGAQAPVLVPIASAAATAAGGAVAGAIVTDAYAVGKAACAAVEAEYKGLQAAAVPAAPASPSPTPPPATPAPVPLS